MGHLESLIGKSVGSYQLKKCLGVGGMGAVFLAEHPGIQSRVAIKVLLPQFNSNETIIRRFLDEARAVNRIGHPGIVRIHDCVLDDKVGACLVMEYLEGETLLKKIQDHGRLASDAVVRILQQACSALTAAHEVGIIHRDLKPANIFAIADPDVVGGERVKILDFGIAKLLEDQSPDGNTATGMLLGSPQYMSPEQCLDAKRVDFRTDVYSLGAIAYALLSGRLPFAAETFGRLVMMHQTQKVPSLRSLGFDVPVALDEVVLRALATKLEERTQSMRELREEVTAAAGAVCSAPTTPAAPARAALAPAVDEADDALAGLPTVLRAPDDQAETVKDAPPEILNELGTLIQGPRGREQPATEETMLESSPRPYVLVPASREVELEPAPEEVVLVAPPPAPPSSSPAPAPTDEESPLLATAGEPGPEPSAPRKSSGRLLLPTIIAVLCALVATAAYFLLRA
jgi:serine/threonine protein kinase